MEFQGFPKMARLSRECVITEKIDGTNGQIFIGEDGTFLVGSRSRWITPDSDDHGFAKWAYANRDELMQLGPGRHFGEWWGSGIHRGYGLPKGEKRFSLFNAIRWVPFGDTPHQIPTGDPRREKWQEVAPRCCHVVPVLWRGEFCTDGVIISLNNLEVRGSRTAPGFMKPEGIVVYHVASGVSFKKTLDGDDAHKGAA